MRKLQTRLAEGRTLVVVVEDMHWADSQSFEILTALVRDPIERPVLGVATARHDERMAELARSDKVTTILVGELGQREREELVSSRFVDANDARALMRDILDRAGGNPFYINEIIESLVERGILEHNEQRSGAAPGLGAPRRSGERADDGRGGGRLAPRSPARRRARHHPPRGAARAPLPRRGSARRSPAPPSPRR